MDVDVIIVGLGPVGATLGNLLGMRGMRVLILEREAKGYDLPRAVHFDDECMRVFQGMGLADQIVAITGPLKGTKFVDGQGNLLIDAPSVQGLTPNHWHYGYKFHQPDLEEVLVQGLARFPNVEVRRQSNVFALTQIEGGVRVRFEDMASHANAEVCSRYVIGCDGARSTVRSVIGCGLFDFGFHERWLVVDLMLKVPRPDLGDFKIQHCDPARSSTYICGVGMRRRWEMRLHHDEPSEVMGKLDQVWRLLSKWITPEEADIERHTIYTFHSTISEVWRADSLLLAGDSAHQTPPFLGQGVCAGIRDASNLAWKIDAVLKGLAPEMLLDTYQQERVPHVQQYIELAVALGGIINTTASNTTLPDSEKIDDNSIRLKRPKPRLGRGFAFGESKLIGTQIPQPLLSDKKLLDDAVGAGFCLLLRSDQPVAVKASVEKAVAGRDVRIVSDAAPELQEWLAHSGHLAVLARPDRYIFGAVDSLTDIDALLAAAFERGVHPAEADLRAGYAELRS